MTIEEKRQIVKAYCYSQPDCTKCKLLKPNGGCLTPNNASEATLSNAVKLIKGEDKDVIKHPDHYCYSKYEPKDVIRAWKLNFNLGSAVKYVARAGRKDDIIQDLKKAKQFLEFEIEALEEEKNVK